MCANMCNHPWRTFCVLQEKPKGPGLPTEQEWGGGGKEDGGGGGVRRMRGVGGEEEGKVGEVGE